MKFVGIALSKAGFDFVSVSIAFVAANTGGILGLFMVRIFTLLTKIF